MLSFAYLDRATCCKLHGLRRKCHALVDSCACSPWAYNRLSVVHGGMLPEPPHMCIVIVCPTGWSMRT
jgi:hypothetical protein